MAVTTRGPAIPAAALPEQPVDRTRMTPAVKICAGIGAACVAFIAYVLISWISGPYFKEVPSGPSEATGLIGFSVVFWQIITIPAMRSSRTWRAYANPPYPPPAASTMAMTKIHVPRVRSRGGVTQAGAAPPPRS